MIGWLRTWNSTAEGYQLENHKDREKYIEELPQIQCPMQVAKRGQSDCPPVDAIKDNSPDDLYPNPFTSSEDHYFSKYTIVPNPVSGHSISFKINSPTDALITWKIIDTYGHLRNSGNSVPGYMITTVSADVGNLENGMYSVITDQQGVIGRFIKI